MSAEPRSLTLRRFALGATAGFLIALGSVVSAREQRAVPRGAVALVNGVAVTEAEQAQALQALASARVLGAAKPEDAAFVRDRLIDHELLLQRALELELPRRDPRLRNEIVSTLLQTLTESDAAPAPSEADLVRYFDEHRGMWASEPRVQIEQRFFRAAAGQGEHARERARRLREQLARGESAEEVGDPFVVELPTGALTVTRFQTYLGPTVARALAELPVGVWSEPVRSGHGVHLVRVLAREPAAQASFEAVRDEVRAAYLRDTSEERLRSYVRELRASADIRLAEAL